MLILKYPQRPASYHLAPIAMHLCFCPFHPSYWRWKVRTVDPVSMGAKQIWCSFLAKISTHQLEKQLLMFNARNKCDTYMLILNIRNWPASDHLAPIGPIVTHLGFYPFHPSYWRWKAQTVDPVSMGCKANLMLFSCWSFIRTHL